MNLTHPLYYDCQYNPAYERYGLLHQSNNCFYIVDTDPKILKTVQLILQKYEFFHLVNIDHFCTFLPKMQKILDESQIEELTQNHFEIVRHAAIYNSNETTIDQIQKNINNNNCGLYGLTIPSARSLPLDMTHHRLIDNIIKHDNIPKQFDIIIQETIFFLRRTIYILEKTINFFTQFATLQEKISTLGLDVSAEFYQMCYPEDTTIKSLIEKERNIDHVRFNSLLEYKKIIYKILNQLNYENSIQKLLAEFLSLLEQSQHMLEAVNPDTTQRTYEVNRTNQVLTNFIISTIKKYE